MERSIEFDPDVLSVAAARRFVGDFMHRHGDVSIRTREVVTLLVSELVTNAVVHAGTRARLTVRLDGGELWVGVGDDDPTSPTPVSPDREHGRGGFGLWLLEELAREWGVDARPQDGRKTVWFRVPVAMAAWGAPASRRESASPAAVAERPLADSHR